MEWNKYNKIALLAKFDVVYDEDTRCYAASIREISTPLAINSTGHVPCHFKFWQQIEGINPWNDW